MGCFVFESGMCELVQVNQDKRTSKGDSYKARQT